MKKILMGFALALGLSGSVLAAGGGFPLDKAPNRTNDMAALQNGAKLFVNYCLSCHSAAFMRYNRLRDIGLNDKQIAENLTFATDKIGDTMKSAIDPRQAKALFGANPPDLTVIARSRSSHAGTGADYIYTLLRTYYRDESKLTGWEQVKPGTLSAAEYDQNVGDLVAYLQWMSEPAQNSRVRIGVWVLLFLSIFTLVAWRLNASYWKDVK